MNPLDERRGGGEGLSTQVDGPAGDTPAKGSPRPSGQLALSLSSMLFSVLVGISLVVATSSGILCSTIAQPSGANIAAGALLVLLGGVVGIVASIVVRNRAGLLRAVLLGEAATVGLAVGLVARDSATARTREDCGFLSSDVSTSTHHVQYAYALLGLVIAVLLSQAFRGWSRTPIRMAGTISGVASVILLAAALPGQANSKNEGSAASRPPKGVLVCRALPAPHAPEGATCDPKADVGTAPIGTQQGLMCWTVLHGVLGKRIGIQVFHDGTLIRHAAARSSDSETSPYVYFDSSWVHGAATGSRLAIGRYRCRFLVDGEVVRSRAVTVERS